MIAPTLPNHLTQQAAPFALGWSAVSTLKLGDGLLNFLGDFIPAKTRVFALFGRDGEMSSLLQSKPEFQEAHVEEIPTLFVAPRRRGVVRRSGGAGLISARNLYARGRGYRLEYLR
jgi:hypothetical protein